MSDFIDSILQQPRPQGGDMGGAMRAGVAGGVAGSVAGGMAGVDSYLTPAPEDDAAPFTKGGDAPVVEEDEGDSLDALFGVSAESDEEPPAKPLYEEGQIPF